MADPVVVATPNAAPPVPRTDPLAPGLSTTEGKGALVALVLSSLAAVVPPLWDALSNLSKTFPDVHYIAAALSVVGILGSVLVSLGYGKQRAMVKAAALTAGGSQAVRLLVLLAGAAVLGLGCAAMSHSVVDTGDVDLGKGVSSRTTSAPTDTVSCTQLWTQAVTFPLPHDSAGTCLFDDIAVAIPFEPGKGAQCKVSAGPGARTCTKLVATSCTVPIPRDAAGACP